MLIRLPAPSDIWIPNDPKWLKFAISRTGQADIEGF